MVLISKSVVPVRPNEEDAQRFPEFLRYLEEQKALPPKATAVSSSIAPLRNYYNQMFDTLNHRRLFQLHSGHIGVGPGNMRIDDAIAVLQAGQWPFVLRRRRGKDGFELIGVCYVDGCADGGLIEPKQATGVEPKLVEIW